jgi:uncharacterized repeat protein (TIGR03806 family)
MKAGVIPYSVNAPFWSDGAHKERWLALPGDSPKIDFARNRGWNCPDLTVLVKSFALDTPMGRKWIETRFLTRQDGEWYGYSYEWNDAQTDAVLVERGGKDRDFAVGGGRTQKWHYPSRAECMVCHSRAANFVLGLSTLQFNRDHDYGGANENQLKMLHRLGVLKVDMDAELRADLQDEAKEKKLDEKKTKEFIDKELPERRKSYAFAPEHYPRLVDVYDRNQDVDKRARSFLHANCSICHIEAGGGNAQMELEFVTARDKMRLFDVKPVHHTYGLPDAKLIAPGHPERSVLLQRLTHRGEGHMPPLATNVVDEQSVEMLREWIAKMKN